MKNAATSATVLVMASLAVCGALSTSPFNSSQAWAQSADSRFDPANPFARITSSSDWRKIFITGMPNIVPNDNYSNLTSSEFSKKTSTGHGFKGQKISDLKGSGGKGVIVRSPYPYKTAAEHYDAWLKAAGGAAKRARDSLPDWSGDWVGVPNGVLAQNAKVSDVMAALSDEYKVYYKQLLDSEAAGHHWWPSEFCLPSGYGRYYTEQGATWHFMTDQTMAIMVKDRPNNDIRYIYTDGRGFLPPDSQFPQWYGGSKGFWTGDELVIHTAQFRPWVIANGMPEYSDALEVIERVKRVGDEMLIDTTMYDPNAFAYPWHDTVTFKLLKDWTKGPATYSECVSTNNVYLDANGVLQERAPGDPGFRDMTDTRPWATAYELRQAAEASGASARTP